MIESANSSRAALQKESYDRSRRIQKKGYLQKIQNYGALNRTHSVAPKREAETTCKFARQQKLLANLRDNGTFLPRNQVHPAVVRPSSRADPAVVPTKEEIL